jgi:uncharacterized BrkB/YihY/UPF0761 family membrane protein
VIPIATQDLPRAALATSTAASTGFEAVPGVVVGVLLLIAAIAWFAPSKRFKFRRATLWLVIAAVAMIIIVEFLNDNSRGVEA